MKTDAFESEVLPAEFWKKAEALLACRDENFVKQVEALGWDRTSDFRHADLSGTDFSNCDLRGYDFTGADLRDCVGINAKWDASTNFAGSDATGSLFEYSINKARYFGDHPEQLEVVRQLTKEIWYNTILGIEGLLRSHSKDNPSLEIVHAVFDETTSTVVRSNILAFMRLASDSAAEHKAFIFNSFAKFSDQPAVVIAGIRTLGVFYRDDIVVFRWLKCFLQNENVSLRREAFKALLASKHFMRGISSLREHAMSSEDSLTRRAFLGRLARLAGPSYVRATTDISVSNFIDFAQPITRRKLEEMAHRTLMMQRLKARQQSTSHNVTEASTVVRVKENEVRELARDYRRYLAALGTQYKIPFVFNL